MLNRSIRRLAAAVLLLVPVPLGAQEFEKNVLTGGPNGTYIQIGRDISGIAASCGMTYQVRESAGSLANFLGVRKTPNTQFGIVQSDVLEYLRTYASDDPDIQRAIFGVRIAFPLYNEEVHVLARRDVAALSDLNGRRVAIGAENSGTFLTASLVLDLASIRPSERVLMNATDSLSALIAGDIDAFFYVAGAPTKLFQSGEINGEQFHLLPLSDPTLQAVYVPTTLPAGTYPFQSQEVDLVAVKAVMMTFDYNPSKNAYHRASCKAVSDLVRIVVDNFGRLQSDGHPKWRNVDLNAIPPGWDIAGCVNAGLQSTYELNCRAPSAGQVSADTLESEANTAYRRNICAVMGC